MDGITSRRRQPGISGNTLKIIAVLSMLLDHAAVALIGNGFLYAESQEAQGLLLQTEWGMRWNIIYWILRFVGRIAFPIFCFLLTEGYIHTRDRNQYALRLFLFALISEAPFDLMVSGRIFDLEYQNVYVTLFIGLTVLRGFDYFEGAYGKQMIVTGFGFLAAYVLRTDYDVVGVAMILLLYLLRNDKKKQMVTGACLGFLESLEVMGGAALAFFPIWKYNGQRGRVNLKYFFYWFYPVHITMLVVIRYFMFGPMQ